MSTKFENINEAMELVGIPGLNESEYQADLIEPLVLKEIAVLRSSRGTRRPPQRRSC